LEPQIARRRNLAAAMRYIGSSRRPDYRRVKMIRLAFLLLLLLLALAVPAAATQTQQGLVVMHKWDAMDHCAKAAQAAFPDFTVAANRQRDASLQACLAGQNLPPRVPLEPRQ
jgi:hypothetical protein